MKKIFLFLGIVLSSLNILHAQNPADSFYPFKEGSTWELSSFNAKGNPTGRNVYTITKVISSGKTYTASVHSTSFNEKDKELSNSDYDVVFSNGDIHIDMKSMITNEQQQQFKDMTMNIEGNDLIIPKSLTVGQVLANGDMKANVYSGSTLFSTISYVSSERKVLAKESVTTPAGTFDAYKVTSKINSVTTTMGIPIKFEFTVIEWYAYGNGAVRSEVYNKSGKLVSYSVLSKITN
ncbi:hypothetical protein [Cytophaga aurantiaca]|uniref:TapB family protein n=1 Tax=Cytophaga aurantiaca TaxID=29530 RepID=UPI00035CEDD4|nr:hypothetical protein [Cytophaga aurantiaca]